MNTFIVMHGGLKLTAAMQAALGLDPKVMYAPLGARVELDPDFVAEVDPAGVQFVSESQYDALVDRVEAQERAEAAIAKLRDEAETAAQKLAAERVNSKLLVAVRAIEAAKKAPSKKATKAAPVDDGAEVETAEKPKKAPSKKAGG